MALVPGVGPVFRGGGGGKWILAEGLENSENCGEMADLEIQSFDQSACRDGIIRLYGHLA